MTTIINGSLVWTADRLAPMLEGYPLCLPDIRFYFKEPMLYLGEETLKRFWVNEIYYFLHGNHHNFYKESRYDSKKVFLVSAQKPFTVYLFLAKNRIISLEKKTSIKIEVLSDGYETK